jgi:hypothetical protein
MITRTTVKYLTVQTSCTSGGSETAYQYGIFDTETLELSELRLVDVATPWRGNLCGRTVESPEQLVCWNASQGEDLRLDVQPPAFALIIGGRLLIVDLENVTIYDSPSSQPVTVTLAGYHGVGQANFQYIAETDKYYVAVQHGEIGYQVVALDPSGSMEVVVPDVSLQLDPTVPPQDLLRAVSRVFHVGPDGRTVAFLKVTPTSRDLMLRTGGVDETVVVQNVLAFYPLTDSWLAALSLGDAQCNSTATVLDLGSAESSKFAGGGWVRILTPDGFVVEVPTSQASVGEVPGLPGAHTCEGGEASSLLFVSMAAGTPRRLATLSASDKVIRPLLSDYVLVERQTILPRQLMGLTPGDVTLNAIFGYTDATYIPTVGGGENLVVPGGMALGSQDGCHGCELILSRAEEAPAFKLIEVCPP